MRSLKARGVKHGQVEVIIEVRGSDCIVYGALHGEGCFIDRIGIGPKKTVLKVHFPPKDEEEMREKLAIKGLKYRAAGRGLFWVQTKSCTACSFLSSTFTKVLCSKTMCQELVQYRVLLPSGRDLASLEHSMKELDIEYEVLAIIPYAHEELTERQREILTAAMNHGYFDESSRISLTELAEVLDLSPSSLSEIMRRSLRKSVTFFLEHKP